MAAEGPREIGGVQAQLLRQRSQAMVAHGVLAVIPQGFTALQQPSRRAAMLEFQRERVRSCSSKGLKREP